jgi:hypothetical protein
MSGKRHVCLAAFVSFAGLSASPAFSSSFSDLFNPQSEEPPAAESSVRECLSQPGQPAAPGQHWVYHHVGHRTCWFQAASSHLVKKRAHHRARDENEAAPPKMPVLEAQDQVMIPPPDVSQAPTPGVAKQVTALGDEVVTLASAAPVTFQREIDGRPDDATPSLAAIHPAFAPRDQVEMASSPSEAARGASPAANVEKYLSRPLGPRLGMIAIALGFSLLTGSLLARLFLSSRDAIRHA